MKNLLDKIPGIALTFFIAIPAWLIGKAFPHHRKPGDGDYDWHHSCTFEKARNL